MNKQLKQVISELKSETESESTLQKFKQITISYNRADIILLKIKNFMRDARQDNIIIRTTSMHKINKLMKDKQLTDLLFNNNITLKNLVYKQLSRTYADYKDMFNKVNFNILLLYRSNIDYRIMLEKDNNLLSSSLYNMLLKQLKMIKIYLKDHLQKEFIISSNALYTSSVLFVKKSEEE